jgi:hypothetical protein
MIFKVQVSLFSTAGKRVLIYNRDRSILAEGVLPPDLADLMELRARLFVVGHFDGSPTPANFVVEHKLDCVLDW